MPGPLEGFRVLELGGRGPVHFCGMMLADLGAEVISVQRPRLSDDTTPLSAIGLGRGRRQVTLDLRSEPGRGVALALVERSDALIEGFLPGVVESLGVGPELCLVRNPRLVYGRITGWGQTGPLVREPAHNLNTLAVSGVLAHLGRRDSPPTIPANLLADGGGSMFLAVGLLAALLEVRSSGKGQVVDASMLDGVAYLNTMNHELHLEGRFLHERGSNLNDSGAPFHDVYETKDERFIAVAAVEDQPWARLLDLLGIRHDGPDRWDSQNWQWWRERLQTEFVSRTRDQWQRLAEAKGVCLSPVLTISEAPLHPHNRYRNVFTEIDDAVLPSPAPRFSRTPSRPLRDAQSHDETREVLTELGLEGLVAP